MGGSDSLRIIGGSSFGRTGLPKPAGSIRRASRLGSGLLPFLGFPVRGSIAVCHAARRFSSPLRVGTRRASQVPDASLHACHALRWTPADPRGPHQFGPSVLASGTVNTVAICFKRLDGAVSSFGNRGLSCGLRVSLCTLQLTCSVFTSAVAVATLGRSGWLSLTPQGLSPCKKRQALLGSHRGRTASCPNRPRTDPGVPFSSTGLFRNTRFRVQHQERSAARRI